MRPGRGAAEGPLRGPLCLPLPGPPESCVPVSGLAAAQGRARAALLCAQDAIGHAHAAGVPGQRLPPAQCQRCSSRGGRGSGLQGRGLQDGRAGQGRGAHERRHGGRGRVCGGRPEARGATGGPPSLSGAAGAPDCSGPIAGGGSRRGACPSRPETLLLAACGTPEARPPPSALLLRGSSQCTCCCGGAS